MASPLTLPDVPVPHRDFVAYLKENERQRLPELLEPFKQYDAKLREVFAQQPDHPVLADQHLNLTPVFNGDEGEITIRARKLDEESDEERAKYVMPLNEEDRKRAGTPAVVPDIEEFRKNFAIFCESSLSDLDWSNVVAAGSSVVTCLLPVPPKYSNSKKALRQYYHDTIAPASDVDLFIYGLNEEEATKKILQIERRIKDSILTETTTIRTKNAITIASQYPTRHIQIVLRIYKSVSEILTGFDVDCSCAAYDGGQVWAAPRALAAYMTQTNTIDLTRRSPSYENRLSKYSRRGFEVYWPLLDRSRVDPTIFERNFARTVGLARLLVLERLPTKSERESYMDERRRERGRPAINRYHNSSMQGNIKDRFEDEVAEWVDGDEVSDYHTFTIPYGPKYHAKKIEKLLYTKDLLLNAEWNKPKDREVVLHRHPAFFGYAEDVMRDCCGFCPAPMTPEEHDIAEEEAKIYVSGDIAFIKDDPGRQAIGSFNPITDADWTEMAYVGNTARLCQAIIDEDLDHVRDWLSHEDSDPNSRDYTGRTPLHLAVMCSSPDIVQALIGHGARLVARLADGRTALHLAAARGDVSIVKMIMQKSEANEEEESKKDERRKQGRILTRQEGQQMDIDSEEAKSPENQDIEMIDKEEDYDDIDMKSTTTGSYVKVNDDEKKLDDLVLEDEDEPDFYDVNVLAWDTQCSPLHLAILNGHVDVVRELVQSFGADALLPIKLLNSYDRSPRGAILTLVLALRLPLEKAKSTVETLLQLGASSAQADTRQTTALHYISSREPTILHTLFKFDEPAAKRAINHLAVSGSSWSPSAQSPLMSAILKGNKDAVMTLLDAGAEPHIDFKAWIRSVEMQYEDVARRDSKHNQNNFVKDVDQPIVLAVQGEFPELVSELLQRGADPNTLPKHTQQGLIDEWYSRYNPQESLLDIVRKKIQELRAIKDHEPPQLPEMKLTPGVNYLADIVPGTYKEFVAKIQLEDARGSDKSTKESFEQSLKHYNQRRGFVEKKQAVDRLATRFQAVEEELLARGAKTFKQLYPDKVKEKDESPSHPRIGPENARSPFEFEFDFGVHDLNDETRAGYMSLFQASWDGDLETIKSLTLAPWGEFGENQPLKIAAQDKSSQSPFHLAVLRGHLDVAKAIIEISFAQYHPNDEKPATRYRIDSDDVDEYDSDSENEANPNDSQDIPVLREIVDDKFTLENIGDVSTQVKSKTSPLTFLGFSCSCWEYQRFCGTKILTYGEQDREIKRSGSMDLTTWAITTGDKNLFTFMLDLETEWTDRLDKTNGESQSPPSTTDFDFKLAIKYGRLDILAEMIRRTGAGLELEALVRKSGVKYVEKPKYYQGLSVHGKKRADWVSAARGTRVHVTTDTHPPLLRAAFDGNLESVEWFLSDTPARHYQAFAEAYKHHKLITHLNKPAVGGFDRVLAKWLNARQDLTLHCAVMAQPCPESLHIVEYLLKVSPGSLEAKSNSGHTPLALAFSLGRLEAAKALLKAGADQTVRDGNGANILHLLLCSAYTSRCIEEKHLRSFLDLVDKRLIASLLTERSSHQPGSLTPLSRWMRSDYQDEGVMRILLEFAACTGNEHLEVLDSTGDTPVHFAVKTQKQKWLKVILEYRPDLLCRENSVGRTPYELAEDAYIASCASNAPQVAANHSYGNSILHQPAETFLEDYVEVERTSTESIWRLCEMFMKEHPQKRRLVSLLDANEVAKRLAHRQKKSETASRYRSGYDSDAESDQAGEEDHVDEVSQWYSSAQSLDSRD
ncbi:ankyrin [Polyplosphaeria fusca]|uniref:Ankyrin n=1 Tax=Polyplosphaeria fusca TaxID=682080 RepID=A0A9P4V6F5_9PLEO|nr:ankyrin [Polyplosphaeria fusca]